MRAVFFFFSLPYVLTLQLASVFNFLELLSQIRMLAARAAASFVLANESNTALLKHFADLLPGILQVGPSPLGLMGFIHSCVDNARLKHVSHHIITLDMLNLVLPH